MSTDLIKSISNDIAKRYHHAAALKDMAWKHEKQFFISIVESRNDLLACTPDSLQASALQAASMGLSFNPQRKHCYLIPRKLRERRQGESKADYEKNVPMIAYASPSYMGLSHIATSSGVVKTIRAQEVYECDYFRYLGPLDKPEYKANAESLKNRANIKKYRKYELAIGVYALAKDHDGDWYCEFVDADTVERIRQMSKLPNSIMWNPAKLWTEGWKKASIRRLFKTLPQPDPRMDQAVQVMDTHEGMSYQHDITEETVVLISDDQKLMLESRLDQLELSPEKKQNWLKQLCFAVAGVESLDLLPAEKFTEALDKLNAAIDSRSE